MRRLRRSGARSRRGNALVQALIAAAILVTTVAGITSMWYLSFSLTANADELGLSYMIARQQIESIKQNCYSLSNGFQLQADGTSVNYFDVDGDDTTSSTANHIYTCTTVLSTTNGLQLATVTVTGPGSPAALYQASTYLVKAGV